MIVLAMAGLPQAGTRVRGGRAHSGSTVQGALYSYGYPGPYNYGTWEYSSPNCSAKPDGRWLCGRGGRLIFTTG